MTLTLPQGKKFVEAPENKKFECPNAIYTLNFNLKDPNKIVITRYFERTKDVVSVADYQQFKEFFNKISESDNKQFAIK